MFIASVHCNKPHSACHSYFFLLNIILLKSRRGKCRGGHSLLLRLSPPRANSPSRVIPDIQYHYVKDAIEDDKIKSYHIDGARNPTDILTKNLGQVLFHQFCPLLGLEVLWPLLLIYIVTQWLLLWVRESVKLNYYYTVYYCSLIYESCLDKHTCFFVSTAMSQNLSASLKISLSY